MCDEIKYAYLKNHPLFLNMSEQKIEEASKLAKLKTVYRGETFGFGASPY